LKLPRNLKGRDLAKLLRKYDYQFVRQDGSHMRYCSLVCGAKHCITIPDVDSVSIGVLNEIVLDVSIYLNKDKKSVAFELFG